MPWFNEYYSVDPPPRSVFPRGDNSNGSVLSGNEHPDNQKSCLSVSVQIVWSRALDCSRPLNEGRNYVWLWDLTRKSAPQCYTLHWKRADYRNKTLWIRPSSVRKFPQRILLDVKKIRSKTLFEEFKKKTRKQLLWLSLISQMILQKLSI